MKAQNHSCLLFNCGQLVGWLTKVKFHPNKFPDYIPDPITILQLDRSPAILTSNDFIRSNEILGKKWPIYVVIGHFVITI